MAVAAYTAFAVQKAITKPTNKTDMRVERLIVIARAFMLTMLPDKATDIFVADNQANGAAL